MKKLFMFIGLAMASMLRVSSQNIPFQPELDRALHVTGSFYDMNGRLVSTFKNAKMPAGKNRLIVKTYKLAAGKYTMSFNAGGS